MVAKQNSVLTAERLRKKLDYDPATGLFSRVINTRTDGRKRIPVGTVHVTGYVVIRVDYKLYKAHRLAWLYVHGEFPVGEIDHINCIPTDNRIANLRDVSRRMNQENHRTARSDNRCGVIGVNKRGGSYRARVRLNGKFMVIGSFQTPELALEAYTAVKREVHAGCTL